MRWGIRRPTDGAAQARGGGRSHSRYYSRYYDRYYRRYYRRPTSEDFTFGIRERG
ncbi:MAG: hypothetical protein ACE5HK_04380 [Candidatus Methylomirabilales bacterium]